MCVWVWVCVCVAQSLCDPMDYSPPGSSVQGILQARVLEWVANSFSRGSSQLRDRTYISCIAGRFVTVWATRKTPQFSDILKIQLLMGRKLWHTDTPPPTRRLFASPRSSVHPPAPPPAEWVARRQPFAGERVSGAHLNTLNLGKANSEFLKEMKWTGSCSVMSDSLRLHGQRSPWNSPSRNTGVGSFSLLQGIFPTQELNQGLLHCRLILYQLSYSSTK